MNFLIEELRLELEHPPCICVKSNIQLLGHQSFTLYDLKVDTLELAVQKQAILNGSDIGQFGYIAGVRFDSSEEFIIVDAKNHKFLVCFSFLRYHNFFPGRQHLIAVNLFI